MTEKPSNRVPAAGSLFSRIVLASGNPGKLSEMRAILTDTAIQFIAQGDLGISDVEETASTFVENALLKARHAARTSGLPALGDDSGICVDALDGAPGLLSARYAGRHGDSAANIAKLVDALRDVPQDRRHAHFHCAIVVLLAPDDPAPLIAEGRWHGEILLAPRGNNGFGYDPVFFDPIHQASAAEIEPGLKNRVSHRAQALNRLRELLVAASATSAHGK